MNIGTILHHKYFNDVEPPETSKKYQQQTLKHFKYFGMFGTGIMNMVAHGPDLEVDYNWRNTDLLVNFCKANDLNLHYNTVVTGRLNTFPDWYLQLGRQARFEVIERHVRSVVRRYKGKVHFYKLVNEVLNEENKDFLGTGSDKIDLVSQIFQWAVDEFPQGKYMLNEYGPLVNEEKRKQFVELVISLQNKGTRIDLIGLQGHAGYNPRKFALPSDQFIISSLDEIYRETELPISITEFDLSFQNHTLESYPGSSIDPDQSIEVDGVNYTNWYEYQGFAYQHFIEICKERDYVESIYFWRFNDDPSINWERPGTGLLDQELELKKQMENLTTN